MIFYERLSRLPDLRPENGSRKNRRVMTSEVRVGFLSWHDQKVTIRMASRRFEVGLLFRQSQRPRVLGVTIPVEVRHHRDVDAQRPKRWNPWRLKIQAACIQDLLVKRSVEVADRDLKTW